ncbi:hypothetical protein MOP88_06825 [Sphingomonas sp. WKB10]|nr:hypothetical protein [Sphingomonas sp. WKB10]
MSNMSSFLNWAVNEELLARNPARGLRLPDPINKRDKRSPFDRDQLHSIFNAPLYRGCVDGGRGYNKVGDQRPRNARYWCRSSRCLPERDWVKSASLILPTSAPWTASIVSS